ncbi:MAG: S41 family peptidase [Candidatus Zixiibacteriota bacterium]
MIFKASRAAAVCLFGLLFSLPAHSQTLGLRHPTPSPDGSSICFGFQGDLWTVSSQGGRAERLTVHVAYESNPAWSPDGRTIAYSSDRNGNFDLFTIPATGGIETQLTWHSDDDIVNGWSPDSRRVLFQARRDQNYEQVWEIPISGGRERPLTNIESYYGSKTSDNEKLIFTRGAIPWWRKGYRGSANCDIYSKELTTGRIEQLTFFPGNDLYGCVVPGSADLIYLSDSTGNYNLYRRNLIGGSVVQMTNHRLDVHHPKMSADGSLVAYELGGEIYLYDLKIGQGRKLLAEIPAAVKVNDPQIVSSDSGLTECVPSPDGNALAFVIGGELFCRSLDGSTQRNLTKSISEESDVSWSEDSRQIVFVSHETDGDIIRIIRSNDPDRPELNSTHDFYLTEPIKSDLSLRSPMVSPSQTRIAYIRGETQLIVTDLKKLTERTIADKNPIGEFAWSPDSRYIVYSQRDGNWDNELFIGDSESGSVEKISEVPSRFKNPQFSLDGKIIYYLGGGDIYYLYLDRQLGEMSSAQRRDFMRSSSGMNSRTASPVAIDFEGIITRSRRLTVLGTVVNVVLMPTSEEFIFATSDNEVFNIQIDGDRPQLLSVDIEGPRQIQLIGESGEMLIIDAGGRLHLINAGGGDHLDLSYRAAWSVSRKAQYRQMFSDVWREIRDRFYDEALHGVDWKVTRENYLARVEAIDQKQDFLDLTREMLGQLNASHLNIWPAKSPCRESGMLGIIPEHEDNTNGTIAAQILPESPASRVSSEIKVFDKITAIGGVKIESGTDPYEFLNGTVGQETRVDLINRSGITRTIAITPLSVAEHRELVLRNDESRNRNQVNQSSKNRVGYIALSQITSASVEQFELELKKYSLSKEALLIDLRSNSGGSEHDRILAILARKPYIAHRPRHGQDGMDSPWAFTGPIALLIDERTSSDAEIVAEGFHQLGLGEVIGVTSFGAVIGTEKKQLGDGSVLSVPTIGWYSMANNNLENHGVSPDFAAPLDLNKAEHGEDNQLGEAVQRLIEKLK